MSDNADHWLRQPPLELSAEQVAHLESQPITERIRDGWLQCPDEVPKWAYLKWLARTSDVLFHGSNRSDITRFEPRTPDDSSAEDFSRQTAVFAASAPLWAIFYAILDRSQPGLRLLNGAFEVLEMATSSETRYFFSVTQEVLERGAWREGTLYLFPGETFTRQEGSTWRGKKTLTHQWASLVPVTPLAKVKVRPTDFPFLEKVRGHSNAYVERRAEEDPHGFPWLD